MDRAQLPRMEALESDSGYDGSPRDPALPPRQASTSEMPVPTSSSGFEDNNNAPRVELTQAQMDQLQTGRQTLRASQDGGMMSQRLMPRTERCADSSHGGVPSLVERVSRPLRKLPASWRRATRAQAAMSAPSTGVEGREATTGRALSTITESHRGGPSLQPGQLLSHRTKGNAKTSEGSVNSYMSFLEPPVPLDKDVLSVGLYQTHSFGQDGSRSRYFPTMFSNSSMSLATDRRCLVDILHPSGPTHSAMATAPATAPLRLPMSIMRVVALLQTRSATLC